MVAEIEQKSPHARSLVALPLQAPAAENQEIGSGKGSGGRKVIEAFMTSTGLKNPRRGSASTSIPRRVSTCWGRFRKPGDRDIRDVDASRNKSRWRAERADFLLANNGLSLYGNGIVAREDYIKTNAARTRQSVVGGLERHRSPIRARPPISCRGA